ncbi:MAG: sulfite exporter TauE/SafE family protein [Chthonomonas sp.]|nr:sulfite exporter TauE/SafE family protein [Chthonomonas sp.]
MPALTAHDPLGLALLVVAGAVASGINSIAGGGSLISFPMLVGLGVPELRANATNAVALWPGSLTGALGFREHLHKTRDHLPDLILPALLGSAAGAAILLATPERLFRQAVPVLILFATLLLAYQPQIRALGKRRDFRISKLGGAACQFLISLYGGYFGAGMGILMLAYLGLMLDDDLHALNALKGWLGLIINFVASIVFIAKGLVLWEPLAAMLCGSLIGGYAAARVAVRVDPDRLRKGIVVLGFVMVAWFTYKVIL